MRHKAFVIILLVQYFLLFAVNAKEIKQLKESVKQDVNLKFQVIQDTIPVGNTVGNCTSCPKNQENATRYLYISDQTSEIEIPFTNPLPLGFIIRDVRVDYVGVYNCDQEAYLTSVSVEVDETVVTGFYQLPVKNDSCVCLSCHQRVPIPPDPMITNWWVGFNYSGENSLRIIFLHNTVAISKIIISFNALNLNPNITSYEPTLAPTTNGGKMTILGKNFLPFFTYKCEFSQGDKVLFSIAATADDSNQLLTCPLPNFITPLNESRNPVSFRLFPDTSQFAKVHFGSSIGPFPFEFYDQPKLSYITPTNGTVTGGTVVDIYGSGFFKNDRLNCRFGYMATYATYHSPNHVSCITPAVPDGNAVQVGVDISENGLSWTNNSIPFNFVVPIDVNPSGLLSPSQRTLMLIIGGAVLLLVLTAGSIAYFIHDQKCKSKYSGYSHIENFDSQLIVPMSEITMKEVIGRGSFGSVYRAYWRHTEVAVKKIDLDPTDALIAELYEEAKLMVSLRHPNVVNFMAVTAPPDVCIITEFVSRGSLYNILHDKRIKLELEHVRKLAIDTCKGMAYLHAARIIHRDLKTHNLLVDKNWNVKVCDFGLSRPIEDMNKTMTACGTPCWTAPEVLRSQRYSFKADVYSFGICLWEMLSREAPYGAMPPYQVVICVATKGMRPTIPSDTPADFRRIVMESWDENPDKRPFFGDLLDDLEATTPPPAESPNPVITESAKGETPTPVASIGRNPSAGGLILKMNSPPPASTRGSGAPSKSPAKPTPSKKKSTRRPSDKKAIARSEPGHARSPNSKSGTRASPSPAPPVQLLPVFQTETSSENSSHDGTANT